MNDPPTGMGAPGLRGATHRAGCPRSLGQAGTVPRGVARGPPVAAGAPDPGAEGSPGSSHEDCRDGQNLDSLSWVREKVLFLLHPERGLGTHVDPALLEAAGGQDGSRAGEGDPESPAPHLAGEKRGPRGHMDPPAGTPPRDTPAPPKSVLVRVVDYQVTQEVLQTAWTKGCLTSRTEERFMTMVTFRTNKQ
ncbi:uncharacterized protein C6orf141 homolog [Artibeus jamaicensis]|uniref:uncharacterized protein C6orf141 homolog n=1 Tax=Artibeus jamaicensis TaxID=9417 RepID=UPI00235B0209|nr:uncharacterized protein C6orf141 homolog [Artibeus jamaicensis]XP_053524304.1 uncharacterized protein C6orf141 homolog [Artibeus jamaicensis]